MATYRGIDVADELLPVLPHMRFVDENREALAALGYRWDMLDVMSSVIDIGADVNATRMEFESLTGTLVGALAAGSLDKVAASLGAKAQVTVDIVIRNLFERTADIGFLATDLDIFRYLSDEPSSSTAAIVARLDEYRRKYSVYDNVLLIGTDGRIRAAAVPDGLPGAIGDGFVRRAIDTVDPYVESFARSDLVQGGESALIYAHRVADPAAPAAPPVGVLALQFGFTAELDGIFARLLAPQDWTILTLLDAQGVVLATSDGGQLAPGCRLSIDPRERHQIVRHGGRRYIAATRDTNGYQGYTGPGWRACALVPIDVAFEDDGAAIRLDAHRYRTIAGNRDLFADDVRVIPARGDAIQAELDRIVWNGALALSRGTARDDSQTAARRTLLSEISATGARTRQIIAGAIQSLNQTAVGAIVADCGAAASLAIDIMDRNLYERANDCRWWALTGRFRDVLSQSHATDADRADLTAILRTINDLYTVYTNLLLFDRDGTIVAVSDPAQAALVGQSLSRTLTDRWTARPDSSFYGVSDFAATPLYDDHPAYIYGAPIVHPVDPGRIVGGIAIVFDTTPQLRSMLDDCVPVDVAAMPVPGSGLVFVDDRRRVLSTTLDDWPVGSTIDLPPAMFVDDGRSRADVLAWRGALYAVGVCASSGYREFKGPTDCYRNAVFAVCLTFLCVDAPATAHGVIAAGPGTARIDGPSRQIATFTLGDRHLAIDADDVVEAIVLDPIALPPDRAGAIAGYGVYDGRGLVVLDPRRMFGIEPGDDPAHARTTVVFRAAGTLYGLLVDTLGTVRPVDADRVLRDGTGDPRSDAVAAIISAGAGDRSAILLLDPEGLAKMLLDRTGETRLAA